MDFSENSLNILNLETLEEKIIKLSIIFDKKSERKNPCFTEAFK